MQLFNSIWNFLLGECLNIFLLRGVCEYTLIRQRTKVLYMLSFAQWEVLFFFFFPDKISLIKLEAANYLAKTTQIFYSLILSSVHIAKF